MKKRKRKNLKKFLRNHAIYRFNIKIGWEKEYEFIKKMEAEEKELNFFTKISLHRKLLGKKMYAYYNKEIKGYWIIAGKVLLDHPKCEETKITWPSGWYLMVKGKFFEPEQKIIFDKSISRVRKITYCEEIF